jgi:enoyl-CoA hydratase/carnithine racemase
MSPALVTIALGRVAVLRLDNPPLNLVTHDLTEALDDVLGRIEADPSVRAVVVAGTGDRAFCAGSDVTEFESLRGRVGEGKLVRENAVYDRLARLEVPTLAAIEGDALGGGLELAMCCDLRVASARARLGMPEVRLGVIPGSGGTHRLPALVGPAKAKEMILLGTPVSADEAGRIGLVNQVVPIGAAETVAMEWAELIATRGPVAERQAKRAIDAAGSSEAAEESLRASEHVFQTEDMIEGVRAFKEKRAPNFQGK